MAISWHFHGTFTYKPYLGTVCQNLLEKLSKKSVVDLFFLPNFSFIFGNILDLCRFYGTFMALSFMVLSWCFPGTFPFGHFGHVWICHKNTIKVPWICQTNMKPTCQIHIYLCLSISVCLSSIFFLMLFSLIIFWKFRLIIFFYNFLWSKYRIIRNIKILYPNPQLVIN